MTPKPWYESATLWLNAVSLVVAIAGVIVDPALAADPRVVTAAAAVVTIGNAALRVLRTAQPIEGSPAAAEVPPKS